MYFFRRKEKRTPKIEQSVRFRTPSFFIHQLIFKHLNLWHGVCYNEGREMHENKITSDMDKEIPKEVLKKERNKIFMKYGSIGAAIVVCMALLISFMQSSVKLE